jgi:hypothetical protein
LETSEGYQALRQLVKKYISSEQKREELLEILSTEQNMPPVRGIINEIYEENNKIEQEDKDLITDLMYYFG